MMKAITLRSIPPEIIQIIQTTAQQMHVSINKAVISLLEQKSGLSTKKKKTAVYHDLDHLSNRWSKKDLIAFQKDLFSTRRIDPELWA